MSVDKIPTQTKAEIEAKLVEKKGEKVTIYGDFGIAVLTAEEPTETDIISSTGKSGRVKKINLHAADRLVEGAVIPIESIKAVF